MNLRINYNEILFFKFRSIIFIPLLILSFFCQAEYLENLKVKKVVDGDTVHVFSGGKILKVRLVEIDAPELNQPYGLDSKEYLEELLQEGYLNLRISGTDIYDRKLARLYWREKDINRLMVRSGYAWVYDKYVTDKTFYEDQMYARSLSLGLWNGDELIQPWLWRKNKINK